MAGEKRYQVYCELCHNSWQPKVKSPLWWKAHNRAKEGYLDAHCATTLECGCKQSQHKPDAPFRVFGFYDDGVEFDIPLYTFTTAVRCFRKSVDSCDVFIQGVSTKVQDRLRYGI